MTSRQLIDTLKQLDLNFLSGVPDSGLRNFLVYVEQHPEELEHIRAPNEGQAIALATGYHLATHKIPVVYMQNSGLGNAVNPLTSLADKEVYGIPMILFIAWRGKPGEPDEPQHAKIGRIMPDLLRALEIPFTIARTEADKIQAQLASLKEQAVLASQPVALIFPKGVVEEEKSESIDLPGMKRQEALEILLEKIAQDPIVATTGYTSREIFEIREHKGQGHQLDFLCVGSMGHASSIALAISQKTKRRVYALDGDGALCMHMGAVAAIGAYAPANLVHIVFDNGIHESTGGQPVLSRHIDWQTFFEAVGYKSAFVAANKEALVAFDLQSLQGPAALVVKVVQGTRKDLGRPTKTPVQNKKTFMNFLEENNE